MNVIHNFKYKYHLVNCTEFAQLSVDIALANQKVLSDVIATTHSICSCKSMHCGEKVVNASLCRFLFSLLIVYISIFVRDPIIKRECLAAN
jgi:hypothetical protein